MKTLAIFLLLTMIVATPVSANPKKWMDERADKISHFFAGGFVAGLSYKMGAAPMSMLLNTTLVGGLKELFDWQYAKRVDAGDWLATILGGIVITIF
jgi:hypothetical protein